MPLPYACELAPNPHALGPSFQLIYQQNWQSIILLILLHFNQKREYGSGNLALATLPQQIHWYPTQPTLPNRAHLCKKPPTIQKKRNIMVCFGKYRTFQASLLQLMMMQSGCLWGRQATSISASSRGQCSFWLNGIRVLVWLRRQSSVEERLQSVEETKLWKLLQWREFLPTTECNGELWWWFRKKIVYIIFESLCSGNFFTIARAFFYLQKIGYTTWKNWS